MAALLVLGSSGNEHAHRHHKGKHHGHSTGGGRSRIQRGDSASTKPVTLALVTHDDMVVCLVPGHGRPLIDSQTLISGSKEGPFSRRRTTTASTSTAAAR